MLLLFRLFRLSVNRCRMRLLLLLLPLSVHRRQLRFLLRLSRLTVHWRCLRLLLLLVGLSVHRRRLRSLYLLLLLLSRRLLRAHRIRRWSVPRLTQPLPGGDIDATLSDRPGPSVIPLLSSFGHAASYVSAARPCSTDLRLASFYWCRAPDMKNRLRLRCAPVRPIYAWHHSFSVDLRTCRIPAFTSRSCLADLRLASFQLLSSFG